MKASELRDLLDGCDDMEVVFAIDNGRYSGIARPVLVLEDATATGGGVDRDTFTETECRDPDEEPNAVCLFLRLRVPPTEGSR